MYAVHSVLSQRVFPPPIKFNHESSSINFCEVLDAIAPLVGLGSLLNGVEY